MYFVEFRRKIIFKIIYSLNLALAIKIKHWGYLRIFKISLHTYKSKYSTFIISAQININELPPKPYEILWAQLCLLQWGTWYLTSSWSSVKVPPLRATDEDYSPVHTSFKRRVPGFDHLLNPVLGITGEHEFIKGFKFDLAVPLSEYFQIFQSWEIPNSGIKE